jgi:hypothetical protein
VCGVVCWRLIVSESLWCAFVQLKSRWRRRCYLFCILDGFFYDGRLNEDPLMANFEERLSRETIQRRVFAS